MNDGAEWQQPPRFGNATVAEASHDGTTVQQQAAAILEARTVAERQQLQTEINEFIARMQMNEFTGARRITIKDGYKKGVRYWFTPKYAKENEVEVVGWTVYVRDIELYVNDPEWQDLLDVFRFGLTVDGLVLEEYMWMGIGLTGFRVSSLANYSETMLSDARWYLAQLSAKYPAT